MSTIPYFNDIPLDRRIWHDLDISELRAMLTQNEVMQLYQRLSSQPYDQWVQWFIANIKTITDYATGDKDQRQNIIKDNPGVWLQIHHAAMYQVGLLLLAKSKGYPLEMESWDAQQDYDLTGLAYAITIWEDLAAQCHHNLFWLFDDVDIEIDIDTAFPFADMQ